MALAITQAESLTPNPVEELDSSDREIFFSTRPWLVVVHRALETADDVVEMQNEIADEIGLGSRRSGNYGVYSAGAALHTDGRIANPIVNMHTTYGKGDGLIVLVPAKISIKKELPPPRTEAEVMQVIQDRQSQGALGEPVVRIPIDNTTTVLWREVEPTYDLPDTAHAVIASADRTSEVTEFELPA